MTHRSSWYTYCTVEYYIPTNVLRGDAPGGVLAVPRAARAPWGLKTGFTDHSLFCSVLSGNADAASILTKQAAQDSPLPALHLCLSHTCKETTHWTEARSLPHPMPWSQRTLGQSRCLARRNHNRRHLPPLSTTGRGTDLIPLPPGYAPRLGGITGADKRHEAVGDVMVRDYIYLYPSLTEALSAAIAETASCGLYVVRTQG